MRLHSFILVFLGCASFVVAAYPLPGGQPQIEPEPRDQTLSLPKTIEFGGTPERPTTLGVSQHTEETCNYWSASEFFNFVSSLTGKHRLATPLDLHHQLLEYLRNKAIMVTTPIRDIFKALGGYVEIIRAVPLRQELVKIVGGIRG